jgi:CheY-like chemotaxis protein
VFVAIPRVTTQLGVVMSSAAPASCDQQLTFVIDDDAKAQDFIAATLIPLGLRVCGYVNGKEALASIESANPAIIFLDVALLRSDAIDVLRGLGERNYGGVVQLMSGGRPSLLEAIARIGIREGMRLAPPLSKPLQSEQIRQVIASLRSPDAFPPAQSRRRQPAGSSR